ncbi:pcdc2 programmed cell death protein 2 -related [Holotrichia oblita]|uniref:Pcdc2 programmed cell death protein 2 -related n=1 Tax=Holotrichia oblita TaxID=644536 RepID=A0ACB9T7K6_HOLOL|nr:pcdc2 programmed cell death protein 2 -related [Holotrichia oblita]
MSNVDIGFAEECEPWQVESSQFPSKIGGKPAWLNLQNLPDPNDLECQSCQKPMIFLCQVYAPYEEDPDNFHRTLFVFICRNSKCSVSNDNKNVVVFRSNLRRDNPFYPYDPPDNSSPSIVNVTNCPSLCDVCGCLAPKRCSKCKKSAYCSREHQVYDWKNGHKNNCERHNVLTKILFDQYEMVVEPEEIEENLVSEEKEMEEYKKLEQEGKTGTLNDVSETELDAHTAIIEDKVFMAFKKRISNNKEQVLRYERNGNPLWIANEPRPENVPNCECCNSERQFEFEIMPQMLSILKETTIDWGVLVVYSCKNSCNANNRYKKEFIFRQDVSCN